MKITLIALLILIATTAEAYEFQLSGEYIDRKCRDWYRLDLSKVKFHQRVITVLPDEICVDQDLTQHFVIDKTGLDDGYQLVSFWFDRAEMPHIRWGRFGLYWFRYRVDKTWSQPTCVLIYLRP